MDHDVVNIRESSCSCGIAELSRISDETDRALFAIANNFYHPARGRPPAFAMWSNVVTDSSNPGAAFREVVEKYGAVSVSPVEVNPRTGNPIAVWLWHIDHVAFKAYYLAEKLRRVAARS